MTYNIDDSTVTNHRLWIPIFGQRTGGDATFTATPCVPFGSLFLITGILLYIRIDLDFQKRYWEEKVIFVDIISSGGKIVISRIRL